MSAQQTIEQTAAAGSETAAPPAPPVEAGAPPVQTDAAPATRPVEDRESRFFEADMSGQAVISHDAFDLDSYDQALAEYPNFKKTIKEASGGLSTAPALVRDLFWSFHKRAPRVGPPAPLKPAFEVNRQIVEQVMNTIEWKQVREAGTADDLMMSSIATMSVAESAIGALGEETIEKINSLNELEEEMSKLFAKADSLDELANKAKGKRARDLFEKAREARMNAEANQREVEDLQEQVEEAMANSEAAVRQAARQGLAAAEGEIDSTNEAIKSFSGGYEGGISSGRGGKAGQSTKEKLQLANRVRNSEKLRQIAEMCGRLTRIALSIQRSRVKHPPDEIASIEVGDNIARVLPSEMALLADPLLEDLFFLKFSEKRLMQYELIHQEPQGKGPIIAVIDESGSMDETIPGEGVTKEVWAKGVALALMAIARLQKRDMAVIHFSSGNQLKVEFFDKGEATPEQAIELSEFFYGGGTVFEPWMDKALTLVNESKFNKADVICITDGLAHIRPQKVTEWNQIKAAREMRAFGILIGTNEGAGTLASITDAMLPLDMLQNDQAVLEQIFSI